ncbi:MAG: isoleucine--tRNA ligase [Phycisphaeraceae bacterium]|nr:MAG: isoleucine--tRNA ligase [Phycisphaeraceae bacterium]
MTTPNTTPSTTGGASPGKGVEEKKWLKASLNLPKTGFAMKASLVQNEPASLKRWRSIGVYGKLRAARAGGPGFVFHDGPPYANGNLHLGHLLNKCLKDFVVRSRGMMGFDCAYVPGWDCHGLPIEHKVTTDLQEKGKLGKLMELEEGARKVAVRRACREHAEKFIKLQRGQMERFLTLADYEHPYLTMQPSFEGATLEVLAGLCGSGLVYRALKPVHWSVANRTALAEAELEYQDREDLSVYVDFEAVDAGAVYDAFGLREAEDGDGEGPADGAEGSASRAPAPGERPMVSPSFMIWTTTPWTLPANLAVAVNPKIEYACVWVDGAVTVVAAEAVERVMKRPTGEHAVERYVVLGTCPGGRLVGLRYRHPFVGSGEGAAAETGAGTRGPASPTIHTVVAADYVTLEDGTGLVHTAPGHGTEDYQTGLAVGLPLYCPVREDGTYDASVPEWLRGVSIWDANEEITRRLKHSGHLFYSHRFTHSYPHDWRSKTPVIFRCTHQWFVGVDRASAGKDLRALALGATAPGAGVEFVPEWGRNRMRGMLESRPDWCISRQRAWGVPIPAFTLSDGRVFMSAAVVRAVAAVVREKGTDAWFTMSAAELLAGYDPSSDPEAVRERVTREHLRDAGKGGDILDVWFESGSTWNSCMRERGLGFPCDLYLEGSDQHRGWFQSSLLLSLAATGGPPFKTLLTHGFIVDKDGKKLSKSRPDAARYEVESLCNEFGMDVMRWWVASLPYENDIKADLSFFAEFGEGYRKVRNTLRFMLSNLGDLPRESSPPPPPPGAGLDAWVMSEFDALCGAVVAGYAAYDFRGVQQRLYDFCNETLSAVYLAAVKDRLYCDAAGSPGRRRTQATLRALTDGLCRLLAPILPHTADEAYRELVGAGPDDASACVHLERFIETGGRPGYGIACDPAWGGVMKARAAALAAMEKAKADLGIENRLDMEVVWPDADGTLGRFDPADLADLLGVSRVSPGAAGGGFVVKDLRGEPRCERSWKRDGTVRERRHAEGSAWLSDRDAAAVGAA